MLGSSLSSWTNRKVKRVYLDEAKSEIEKSLQFDSTLKLKKIKGALDMMSPDVIRHHVQMGMVESSGGIHFLLQATYQEMKEKLPVEE